MAHNHLLWRRYGRLTREKVLTAEQEKILANNLRQSKIDLWSTLLSDPNNIEMSIGFILDATAAVNSKNELDTSSFQSLIAAVRRFLRRPVQANASQLRRQKEPVVKALAAFDACMDIAIALSRHVKKMQSIGRTYSVYVQNVESALGKYIVFRNKFIERNVRLVILIAKKFTGYGIPLEDLIQEGMFGLHRAAGLFDPDMGYKFSTYASWWIRASITRYCRNRGRIVRLPVGLQERIERYYAAAKLLEVSGESCDTRRLSKMTGISTRGIRRVERETLERYLSIDSGTRGGASLSDVLAEDGNRFSKVDSGIDYIVVEKIMRSLPDRLQYILRERNGIGGGSGRTLQEIADDLNISRERVRQLESKAIEVIRGKLDILKAEQ